MSATSSGSIKYSLISLSFLLVSLIKIDQNERSSPKVHSWNYEEQAKWDVENRECAGRAQSPIDIQRRLVIENGQLKLRFYNYNKPTKFSLQNAHHTIKLNPIETSNSREGQLLKQLITADDLQSLNSSLPSNLGPFDSDPSVAYDGEPSIKLEWLDDGNNEFKLHDIHLHWAERRDNGSEHAIDGRRAAMEMHLVHIKHGLDKAKIGFTSDSVTVIAILIESYRKSNADFNPIVNSLTRINMTNQADIIEYKAISDLLPNNLDSFYTYSGSLTTPPCFQVVNWIVMSERLYMNAKQIEMFRNIYSPLNDEDKYKEPSLIMPNVRNIQNLGQRAIMASFAPLQRHEKQVQISATGTTSSTSEYPIRSTSSSSSSNHQHPIRGGQFFSFSQGNRLKPCPLLFWLLIALMFIARPLLTLTLWAPLLITLRF